MIRQRMRIRFCKQGDLRMIGHLDLLRTFERLFRRAGVPLGMSEGYHPKARISFPSALGLGIVGTDEVVEVECAEEISADEMLSRLRPLAPPGLAINSVQAVEPGEKKAQAGRMTYEIPVPAGRRDATRAAIEQLLAQSTVPIERPGRTVPIDARADLEQVELADGVLRFRLRATRTASVRPREVLELLGLTDLEEKGCYLSRTKVELASATSESMSHEKRNADQRVAAGGMPDRDR